MTKSESSECHALGLALAEVEDKLMFWRKQAEIAELIIAKLAEKHGDLVGRRQAIMAKAAGR